MPDKLYVTVKAAIWKGDKLLLQKEIGDKHFFYSLPGGRLNKGEAAHDGLRREVREEIGVGLAWISELPVKVFTTVSSNGQHGIVGLVYEAKLSSERFRYDLGAVREVESAAYVDKATVLASPPYVHTPFILEYFDEHLTH